MENKNRNICVVGLGLIGGSFAYHLKNAGFKNVWGLDIHEDTLKKAEENKMIDRGFSIPDYPLSHSDIVILCLYPDKIVDFVKSHLHLFKENAILMDTGGIKRKVLQELDLKDRMDLDFIGGHPMAGNEGQGLSSASESLFLGANFILTPTGNNKEENLALIIAMLKSMGFGSISQISPEMHDEVIGYTSQLPHLIAAALINSHDNQDILRFTGNSFDEFTRIAKLNAPLWRQLILGNQDNVLRLMDSFIHEMQLLRDAVATKDSSLLESLFVACTNKKKEMK